MGVRIFAMTPEELRLRGREIYGDKYCYNKSVYIDDDTDMIVECNVHGPFKVTPRQHFCLDRGCPECFGH